MDEPNAAAGTSVLEPACQQLRADAYRLLAACFYPPSEGIFEGDLLDNLARVLDGAGLEAAAAARTMAEGAAKRRVDELAVEHARLFVGPFKLEAPPYGSVYLDGDGRVMGDSTLAVRDMYASEGLALSDRFGDMADHIAAELEFVHFLIASCCGALSTGHHGEALRLAGVQRHFLGTFVAPWIGQLCDRIRAATQISVYQGLADCVSMYVRGDLEHLDRRLLPELAAATSIRSADGDGASSSRGG